ncbi:thioesterase II family protein [Streptomyces sp. GC420]|uniref:thioesterase II family protein n=1 Tax=Streptomyces sp. GC420 TaxID=2697568 RepID=UPI0014151B73|nr:alpha/beta fold hydrolase [Streptomyces sp. GC420]NBM14485.1 alpha/beta fold hydrolase [Streptomyces sp. GC420]
MSTGTTLVCLPFAGAGASFYRPWQRLAGDGLTILPLQLPGRERRIDEDPYTDAHAAADGLLAELRDTLGDVGEPHRVALFGHSLGAVLAYELAHRLTAAPGIELVRLFVSGSPQPAEQRARRATGLPDDEFLARVNEFAGYTHEALEDPEMRELILPTLRADVEMHENYVPGTDTPLPAPITSLRGADDELVSRDEAAAWSKVAGADFRPVELPGGHMYLTESPAALLEVVSGEIRRGACEPCA